jgi:hypothetical protein
MVDFFFKEAMGLSSENLVLTWPSKTVWLQQFFLKGPELQVVEKYAKNRMETN